MVDSELASKLRLSREESRRFQERGYEIRSVGGRREEAPIVMSGRAMPARSLILLVWLAEGGTSGFTLNFPFEEY